MKITSAYLGKGAKAHNYYMLSNDDGGTIARFKTFEDAVAVSHYLQDAMAMTESERQRAREAIREVDREEAARAAEKQARALKAKAARAAKAAQEAATE
jgi:hypothetical protein